MALAVIRPVDTQQRIRDLIQQLHNNAEQERLLEETRQCVRHFEQVYNMPSTQVHQAIDAGDLEETLEVSRWILLFNILQRVDQA
jgi:hypothetical protein